MILDDLVSKTQRPHGLILVFQQLGLHRRFITGNWLQLPVDQGIFTLGEDDLGCPLHV